MAKAFMPFFPGIITDFLAVRFQFGWFSPSVFKTMQVDENTHFMQGLDFVKKIKHASIVRGKGDIMTNDMQMLFQKSIQDLFIKMEKFFFFRFPVVHEPCLPAILPHGLIQQVIVQQSIQRIRDDPGIRFVN